MRNPRRTASTWWCAFLATCIATACKPAQPPSATPERAGIEVIWQHPIDLPPATTEAPWLAAGHAAVFVAGPAVGLMAFDLSGDGTLLWSSPHVSALPPVATGDVVLTVDGQSLVAVRQDRDEIAWRAGLDSTPERLCAIGDRVGVVIGPDLRTWDSHGAAAWHLSLGAAPATPFVSDSGVTYVGLEDGSLVAIETATGAIQRRIPLTSKPESLASGDQRLYLSTVDGHLYSFDKIGKPKPRWNYPKIRAIGQPVVDARSVYFTLFNNLLYAFTQGGGSERWHTALPGRPVTGPFLLGGNIVVPLTDGRVIELRPDGHIRPPAAAPKVLPDLTMQSAVATADGTGVLTVSTAQDQKRILMAWGMPKG